MAITPADIPSTVASLNARVGEFNVRLGDAEDEVKVINRKVDRVAIALVLSAVNFLIELIIIGAVAIASLVNR